MKIKDVSGLLDKIGEIELVLPEKEKLHLEPANFKINSEGWEEKIQKNIVYKINPEGDIAEYVSGVPDRMVSEQLFTWDAAMRETKKAGKRIPTNKELDELEEELKACKVFPGYWNTDGIHGSRGTGTCLWSSTESSTNTWARYLYRMDTTGYRYMVSKTGGFPVRCLRKRIQHTQENI